MKKQKPLTKQQEIMNKHWVNPFQTMPEDWYKAMGKMMDEWGKEMCIDLLLHLGKKEYDFSAYPLVDKEQAEEFFTEFLEDKIK